MSAWNLPPRPNEANARKKKIRSLHWAQAETGGNPRFLREAACPIPQLGVSSEIALVVQFFSGFHP